MASKPTAWRTLLVAAATAFTLTGAAAADKLSGDQIRQVVVSAREPARISVTMKP